jgi:hypothetical protein
VDPYLPAGQGPVQAFEVRAVVAPYLPDGHGVQTDAPTPEYWPAGHAAAVADVDPGAQMYPAAHWPEQVTTVCPLVAP